MFGQSQLPVELGGEYLLLRPIGSGGMATVFEAEALEGVAAPPRVAVKVLHPHLALDGEIVARFRAEWRALVSLRHANLIGVFGGGVDERQGCAWYAMELLEQTLPRQAIFGMPLRDKLEIVRQAASGIGALHAAGVVHRDVKPANLLVCRERDRLTVRVTDLGVAKRSGVKLTSTGVVLGSPYYMSPEQMDQGKNATTASDVYSLGATLYHLLAGQPPYVGLGELEIMGKLFGGVPPAPLSELAGAPVPDALEDLVARMMAGAPEDRPAAMGEVMALIDALLAAPPPGLDVHRTVVDLATDLIRREDLAPAATGQPSGEDAERTIEASLEFQPLPSSRGGGRAPTTVHTRRAAEALGELARTAEAPSQAAPISQAGGSDAPTTNYGDDLDELTGESVDPQGLTRTSGRMAALAPSVRGSGDRVDRYVLGELIGAGAFGQVWRAHDPVLKRDVAIKLLRGDQVATERRIARTYREAQSVARLRHPAIVPVYAAGEVDGLPFIVSELLPGPDLASHIADAEVDRRTAVGWIARLAEALDYAHGRGIVHRDVKPANVLLDVDGEPALTDFGLAMAEGEDGLTRSGAVMGTPAYMSPEQARGRGVGPASDVYALGVMLYELLCGRRPFDSADLPALIHDLLHRDPPPARRVRSDVPGDLDAICRIALARETDRRYPSAGALARDLRDWLAGRPVRVRQRSLPSRLALWLRRNPALGATIAVAGLVVAVVTAAAFARVTRERDQVRRKADEARRANARLDRANAGLERAVQIARARQAEAMASLGRALAGQAGALVAARGPGWRTEALDRIERAVPLTPAGERDGLRSLALTALTAGGPSLGVRATWSPAHPAPIASLAAGGGRALSVDREGNAWVWDVARGERLGALDLGGLTPIGRPCITRGRWLWLSGMRRAPGQPAQLRLMLWDLARVRGRVAPAAWAELPAVLRDARGGRLVLSANGALVFSDLEPTRLVDGADWPRPRVVRHEGGMARDARILDAAARYVVMVQGEHAQLRHLPSSRLLARWHVGARDAELGPYRDGRLWFSAPSAYLHGWIRPWTTSEPFARRGWHDGRPRALVALADRRVVTADGDGRLRLFRGEVDSSRADLARSEAGGEAGALCGLPDDGRAQRLLAGHVDGRLRLWAIEAPEARLELVVQHRLVFQGDQLTDGRSRWSLDDGVPRRQVALQPDGPALLAGWDAGFATLSGRRLARHAGGAPRMAELAVAPAALAVSSDGEAVLLGFGDGTLRRWRGGRMGPVRDAGVGPLSRVWWAGAEHAVARGAHGFVRVSLADGRVVSLGSARPSADAVACRGSRVAWLLAGGAIGLRDGEATPAPLATELAGARVLAFGADTWVALSDGAVVERWDLTRRARIDRRRLAGGRLSRVARLAVGPSGRWLVAAGPNALRRVDLARPDDAPVTLGVPFDARELVVTRVGSQVLAVARDRRGRVLQWRWEAAAGQAADAGTPGLVHVGGFLERVWAVAVDPRSGRIVSGDHLGDVRLTGPTGEVTIAQRHPGICWAAGVSADGRLATAGAGLCLRDPASGAIRHQADVDRTLIQALRWDPARPRVWVGTQGGSIKAWDPDARRWVASLARAGAVHDLCWSPDGRWLVAAADDGVRLWSVERLGHQGARPDRQIQPPGPPWAVAFSPDGKVLAIGTERGRLMLVDVAAGWRPMATIDLGIRRVRSLAFSGDGSVLAVGAYDDRSLVIRIGAVVARLRALGLRWPG